MVCLLSNLLGVRIRSYVEVDDTPPVMLEHGKHVEYAERNSEHRKGIAGYDLRNAITHTSPPALPKVADGPKPAT